MIGCPLVFQIAHDKEQPATVRYGSHLEGGPKVSRKLRINNSSSYGKWTRLIKNIFCRLMFTFGHELNFACKKKPDCVDLSANLSEDGISNFRYQVGLADV